MTESEFMGYLVGALGGLVGLAAAIKALMPKQPCQWGSQKCSEIENKLDRQESAQAQKNREFDDRLLRGSDSFKSLHREFKDSLEKLGNKLEAGMKELAGEFRAEVRRVEVDSRKGDEGLKQLSKDLVNAVGTVTELVRKMEEK